MLSLRATPNSSCINEGIAFRSSKSLSVGFLCGTREQFSASGYKCLQVLRSGSFWSKTQAYAIIYLPAIWFLRKSNLNISKGSCCLLKQLTETGTAENTCTAVHFKPSILMAQKHKQSEKEIENGYLVSAHVHPILHCNDSAKVLTKVCLFRSGASPSKTKTGRIRKNSNLQSR